eukprot:TRINITY_DN7884_c0_g1_i1.p1 TRINITY_DN7884_c0_g1~~TRINITY_DN7884_c0_g1_i1.p1  ORF type:complete len:242 (+),score=39.59 TRINITY_DN7884_c0_g1_i1:211-936(+)
MFISKINKYSKKIKSLSKSYYSSSIFPKNKGISFFKINHSNKNKFSAVKFRKEFYSTDKEYESLGMSELFKQQQDVQMQMHAFVMKCFEEKKPLHFCREDFRAQDPKNPSSVLSGLILDMTDSLILINGEDGIQILRSQDVTSVIYDTKELNNNVTTFNVPKPIGLDLESWESVLEYIANNNTKIKNIRLKRQDVSFKEFGVEEITFSDRLVFCKIRHPNGVVDGTLVFPPEELSEICFSF